MAIFETDKQKNGECANMQDAATLVSKNILLDRENVDLSSQLNVTSLYSSVSSGLNEDDYPAVDTIPIPLVSDIRRVPLPPELVEQFGHMQCNCIMGIFPEIYRAWLTVDSDIFVWRYNDGDDLAYFDGLSETILSVALVQPKPGIFREHIRYLLVLATPLDIVLLGVSFADGNISGEMHLLPDPLFTLPSDGAYITNIIGTHNGRIFMGGRDGFLFEIAYQASGGWFSRKCTKVNHSRSRLSFLVPSVLNVWLSEEDPICQLVTDDTRNIIYTRSEKGTITVYDLGHDGWGLTCVAQSSLDSIRRRAASIACGIEPSNLNELVHIAPVTLQESRQINLVAVTQAGVRLYFITCQPVPQPPSTSATQNMDIKKLTQRPSGLYLVHVRLPPGFTGTSVQRPTSVHAAHYNKGTLLLSSSNGDDGVLWCINNDMFAFDRLLRETKYNFGLDGRSWAISEVSGPLTPLSLAALPPNSPPLPPPDPPIHVLQHSQTPPEYVIITGQGCHIFSKLRPVDQLRYLLDKYPDPDSEPIQKFFKIYNQGEAACCCIILATSSVPSDRVISDLATVSLMQHGGVTLTRLSNQKLPSSLTHYMVEPMSPISSGSQRQPLLSRTPGGLPVISTPMPGSHPPPLVTNSQQTQPNGQPEVHQSNYYSERQEGLFKMFSRIVRPLWEGKLVEDFVISEHGKEKRMVISRIDEETVSLVTEHLMSLKNFISKHCMTHSHMREFPHLHHDHNISRTLPHGYRTSDPHIIAQQEAQRRLIEEATSHELLAIKHLHGLCDKSIQVFGMWRLMLHHQIHVLYEALDKLSQPLLKSMSFSDIVVSGDAMCRALISALVGQYIDDHSTIDALSSQLREICPDLYSPDDAICSKASELMSVLRTTDASQRTEQLHEAAKLFQQVAGSINLPHVIQQYYAVRYYSGVVELCLLAAQKKDAEGLALRLYLTHSSNDVDVDPVVRKAYMDRAGCYKCITDMLEELMLAGESRVQAPSVPTQPGPPTLSVSNNSLTDNLAPEEAQLYAEDCLQLALNSTDELFHTTLYEWMLRRNLTTQLLKVTSPFIEPFLKRVAATQDEAYSASDTLGSDLLWQYFERTGQHLEGAKILTNLAERPGSDRCLAKRIEYLSRAKMNSKCSTSMKSDHSSGQLLQELEEKLEVAQIQLETMEQLREMSEHDSCSKLDFQLMDVTTLYSEFAEPFQLAECKLAIVHCAGLHDPNLVEALWQNIIECELSKSGSSDQNPSVVLQNKVVQLSKRYMASQRYFPIEFLVQLLEKVSSSRSWELTWASNCFLQAGYPLTQLLIIYQKLHSQKLGYWSTMGNSYHLLYVVNEMLNSFLDDPMKHLSNHQQRHPFLNRALDTLAANLVELSSVPSPSDHIRQLIARMRKTQASLENMQHRTR